MEPQNPHQPYTTQNVDWERQQQANRDAEQRRFQENMRAIERGQNMVQPRFGGSVGSHPSPPAGWERAIVKLVRGRSGGLDELAEELEG